MGIELKRYRRCVLEAVSVLHVKTQRMTQSEVTSLLTSPPNGRLRIEDQEEPKKLLHNQEHPSGTNPNNDMPEPEAPVEPESSSAAKMDDGGSKKDAGEANANVQNSFSANSPYYSSYVENEMRSMNIMHDTLKDVASRTKTFGKCGALMSESTRRLALACRLRRPYVVEDEKDAQEVERQHEMEVAERRRAVGDDMASLLSVMSEVSKK